MESKMETRAITAKLLAIYLTTKERDSLVDTLNSLLKKAKPDRLEEFVVKGLIEALQKPAEVQEEHLPQPEDFPPEKLGDVKIEYPDKTPQIDKIDVIRKVKERVDPLNKENINDFIKNSIAYAQKTMAVKTVPKSSSVEGFYDFLIEAKIIDKEGNPLPR